MLIFSGIQFSRKCVPIQLFCYKHVNINIHFIPYKENFDFKAGKIKFYQYQNYAMVIIFTLNIGYPLIILFGKNKLPQINRNYIYLYGPLYNVNQIAIHRLNIWIYEETLVYNLIML